MFPSSAARNYARGLVAAASGTQTPGALAVALSEFGQTLAESRELARTLGNVALPVAKRIDIARAVAKASGAPPVIEQFLAVLIQRGHLKGLPVITAAVQRAASEASGVTIATVRTSHPQSPEDLQKIGHALGQAVGRKVEVQATVDAALIGGFVARVGDLVFDGSIARQLSKLRGELTRG